MKAFNWTGLVGAAITVAALAPLPAYATLTWTTGSVWTPYVTNGTALGSGSGDSLAPFSVGLTTAVSYGQPPSPTPYSTPTFVTNSNPFWTGGNAGENLNVNMGQINTQSNAALQFQVYRDFTLSSWTGTNSITVTDTFTAFFKNASNGTPNLGQAVFTVSIYNTNTNGTPNLSALQTTISLSNNQASNGQGHGNFTQFNQQNVNNGSAQSVATTSLQFTPANSSTLTSGPTYAMVVTLTYLTGNNGGSDPYWDNVNASGASWNSFGFQSN
jgi:hypothetical protein